VAPVGGHPEVCRINSVGGAYSIAFILGTGGHPLVSRGLPIHYTSTPRQFSGTSGKIGGRGRTKVLPVHPTTGTRPRFAKKRTVVQAARVTGSPARQNQGPEAENPIAWHSQMYRPHKDLLYSAVLAGVLDSLGHRTGGSSQTGGCAVKTALKMKCQKPAGP
jgi:hypothetical protein